MIALLDRKFDRDFPTLDRIEANTSGCVYTVSQHWWLVMRQSVVEQWLRGTVPTRDARIVALEDLIRLFDPAKLDDLVLRIVGRNFARCWGLRFP